jgi:hypothetical protein
MIHELGTVQADAKCCVTQFRTEPVKPAQLSSIESVHRGFLYQHLYSVGCLLNLLRLNDGTVRVERDEDLEVAVEDSKLFVQIKTRSRPLVPSDIEGSIENFEAIRTHYSGSAPEHEPQFVIVSNVPLGTELQERKGAGKFPADLRFIVPGDVGINAGILPPPWLDVNEGLQWCIGVAKSAPFSSLLPETLVWKLAARVQFAATGEDADRRDHSFTKSSVHELIEQYVEQLQEFPAVPSDYRPQEGEPPLRSEQQIRLIVGLTGAGKTVWASWQARHNSCNSVYFDVSGLPGQSLAASLAREMAARFLRPVSPEAARLPATAGLDLLRAACRRIVLPEPPLVVLDNVHKLGTDGLREILTACPGVQFVLMGQPWAGQGALEAVLQINAEQLQGWNDDALAAVFAESGVPVTPQTASRWLTITGGIPLFVKNAAQLASARTDGDAKRLADEVEEGAHTCELAQEALLRMVVEEMSPCETRVVMALSLSEVPLTYDEVETLLRALPAPIEKWAPIMRSLQGKGILQVFGNGSSRIHDAMRVPVLSFTDALRPTERVALQTKLRDILMASFAEIRDLGRLGFWMRLLAPTGEVETLVDISTHEWFHEFGEPDDLKAILKSVGDSPDEAPELRFWALDALAFWDLSRPGSTDVRRYLTAMEALIAQGQLGNRENVALALKKILLHGRAMDPSAVARAFAELKASATGDPVLWRIARYNYATALFHCNLPGQALSLAEELYGEYYALLGAEPCDIIGANTQDIIQRISLSSADWNGDAKRLADCLNLAAMCKRSQGEHPRLAAIHAAKFYAASGSYRSALKVTMDIADDFVATGDAQGARETMESHALPIARHAGLTSLNIEVRSLYAVILAYCGEIPKARVEMESIRPYLPNLPKRDRDGIDGQCEIIDKIATGKITLPRRVMPMRVDTGPKVSRNAPCPCGSGKKFKKCCIDK